MKYSSFRKFTAGLSTLTLLVTSLFTFGMTVTAATTFTDASKISDWAQTYISQLVDAGVLSGNPDGSFNPGGQLNRAEIAKIAVLAAGLTTDTTGAPHFNDVKADAWFYNYIETLYNNGVVAGINGGALDSAGLATYNPSGLVDRASAAKILVTAFDLETAYAGTPPNFPDVAKGAWYFDYVESAYAHGLLSGYSNGNFGPADPITREQIAKIAQNSKTEAADSSLKLADYKAGAASAVAEVPTPTTSDGTLSVALSASTPSSATIPGLAVNVSFTKIDLTASSAGDVAITSIKTKRTGLGSRTDLDKVSLLDESGKVLVKGRTINSDDEVTLTVSPSLIIAAGTTKTVTVAATIAGIAVANSGAENRLEVISAEGITNNAKSVSGVFPIKGNLMKIGSVDIGEIVFTNAASDANVKVGESEVILGEFDVDAPASGEGDAALSYIRMKNVGSAKDDAVSNLKLLASDGTVLATDAEVSNDYIEFSLDTPYTLAEGNSYSFIVRGDIDDGQGDDIELVIDENTDVLAESDKYDNFGVAVDVDAYDAAGDGGVIDIEGAEITVDFDGPSATDTSDDTKNFIFANLKIKSQKDVELTSLTVDITETDGSDAGAGVVDVDDLELVSADGLYSATAGAGNADADADAPATYEFENIVLSAGKEYTFQIRGDIPDGAGASDTYRVAIDFANDVTAEYVVSGDTVADDAYSTTTVTGKVMTVSAPTLTARVVTLNAFTAVSDADGVLLYKSTLEANDVRDIKVTKIVAAMVTNPDGDGATYDADADEIDNLGVAFDTLKLVQIKADGTETVLDSENSLSGATSVTFSGFTFNIPKGISSKVTYGIRGDVKSTPTAGMVGLKVDADADYTAKDSDNKTVDAGNLNPDTTDGPDVTVAVTGSFTITLDTTEVGTNVDKYALAGTTVLIGRYKLDAKDEAVRIRDLTITNAGTATADDIANIVLFKDKAMTQQIPNAKVGLNSVKKAVFEDINYDVAESGIQYLYVAAELKGIGDTGSNTGHSGRTIVIDPIAADELVVDGIASGDEITETFTGGTEPTATVVAAQITALANNGTNATFSNGTYDLFRFKTTANTNTNVTDGETADAVVGVTTLTLTGAEISEGVVALAAEDVGITGLKVKRVDKSTDGEVTVDLTGLDEDTTVDIDFETLLPNDSHIESGEVAEFVVRATFADVGADESVQAAIDDIDGGDFNWSDGTTNLASLLINGLTSFTGLTGHTLSK